jgi:hypothetical protein
MHQRPTHLLHLTSGEKEQLQKLLYDHPKTGALKLVVGMPSVKGPGKSITDISPVLINTDRVRHEKKKVKLIHQSSGETSLEQLKDFELHHPGFLRYSQVGIITVLVLQSAWMAFQLIQDTVLKEPVNGIVSDAAHGYWRVTNWVLIVSSVYSQHLHSWTPAIFSMANGVTVEHYRIHFLALFNSLAMECERRNHPISDELLGMVMDFSSAEAGGFIAAFIDFWKAHEADSCTSEELEIVAKTLLKGCEQHF